MSANTYIPIMEGKFSYEMESEPVTAYSLVFLDDVQSGRVWETVFFNEPGIVEFDLYPMDFFFDNQRRGTSLNDKYQSYLHEQDSIFHIYASMRLLPEYNRLSEQLSEYKNNTTQTEALDKQIADVQKQINTLTLQYDSLSTLSNNARKQLELWEMNYVENNPSLIGLTHILPVLENKEHYDEADVNNYIRMYEEIYEPLFHDNPLSKNIETILDNMAGSNVGKPYKDFTLPDINGKSITLSDQIKDKIAVIDLWASWCGSCLRSSRELIPVYERYKNNGFTVIGVNEESSVEKAKSVIAREKHPWITLIEVNDEINLWREYGIPNYGGSIFLVGKDGIIHAINPSAEEIENYLKESLE